MSYYHPDSCDRRGLTENELSCGLHHIIDGTDFYSDYENCGTYEDYINVSKSLQDKENKLKEKELQEKELRKKELRAKKEIEKESRVKKKLEKRKIEQEERAKKRKTIINIIAGVTENSEIYKKVMNQIFNDWINLSIYEYATKERLDISFIEVAKTDNGLSILIKSILKKYGYDLTQSLMNEVNEFIDILKYNIFNEIVYDRVSSVQKFIHRKVEEKNGVGSHRNMNKQDMKNILSASRLFFNLQDIKSDNIVNFLNMWEKNNELREKEFKNPTEFELSTGKITFSLWKFYGMKLLLDFLYTDIQLKIKNIMDINRNLEREKYINMIIKYYP